MSLAEERSDATFYPPDLWGLSFLFNIFNKLYIRDILNLKSYPTFPGAFAYGNHPIYKVDIIGIVVKAEEKDKSCIYAVDDGTGVISTVCWKRPFGWNDSHAATRDYKLDLPAELQARLTKCHQKTLAASGYQLGDLIHVRGKLKVYCSMMEICASYHQRIDNPSMQVGRMQDLPVLYHQCYNRPFVLPTRMTQEAQMRKCNAESRQGSKEINLVELIKKLEVILENTYLSEFSIGDLLEQPAIWGPEPKMVPKSATELAVRQALSQLEESGMVCCRKHRRPTYENLTRSCNLDRVILSILHTECCKSKYKERGCHYLHVVDELRKIVQYSAVKEKAVMRALDRLETDSDVIRTSDKYYLPLVI